MLKQLLIVGLGGFIGTMMRFGTGLLFRNTVFPYATLTINIAGSLLIGIVLGITSKDINFAYNWKIFLAAGVCGGFTTFSAFSLETLLMLQQGKYFLSMIYILASITAGILAAFIGFRLSTS